MNSMNIDEVMDHLPHRYPFLLVDRVIDHEKGSFLLAQKNITISEPWFTGHFPEKPVMPGVLIVEALAQAAAVLAYKTSGYSPKDYLFYLASLNEVRFRRVVIPGDQLNLKVTFLDQKRNFWKIQAQATVGDALACSAEMMCAAQGASK